MDATVEYQYDAAAQERPRSSILESCAEMKATLATGVSRFMCHWKIIVAGQTLSFLLAAAGAASASMHIDCNLSAPVAQTAIAYFFMSWHIIGKGTATGTGTILGSWTTGFSTGERTVPESVSTTAPASAYKNRLSQLSGRGFSITNFMSLLDLWKRDTKLDNRLDLDLNINGDNNTTVMPSTSSRHHMENVKPKQCNEISTGEQIKEQHQCHSDHEELALDLYLHPPHALRCIDIPICLPTWTYVLFAFIHVQANYFTYLAFRYTAMTSVSLLDNLNILSAMFCSKILLKRQYRKCHLLGAFICLVGVGLNLMSDYQKSEENPEQMDDINDQTEEKEYPQRLMGDLFAILGGLLVGLIDVLIEMLVKDFGGTNEYIGMVGLFGFVLSILQAGIFERDDVAKFFNEANVDMDVADEYAEYADPYNAPRTCSKSKGLFLLSIYILTIYFFNVGVSRFLTVSESAFLTLSLLTGDLWAVSFTVVAEHVAPHLLFYVALIFIVIGVIIYETAPSPLEGAHFSIEAKSIDKEVHNDSGKI